MEDVTMVRVYLTEHNFQPIIHFLRQQAGVRGLTVCYQRIWFFR